MLTLLIRTISNKEAWVKNPPAEQVALEPTPIRGLTFVHSKKIVLSYLQSALIAIQEETPINICTVSNNKQEELITKW